MKKVLSVALASAMVLGMGVNAFADISYNTGVSSKEVSLKKVELDFQGDLLVERDGKVYTTTELNKTEEGAEFRPDDTIYMPLWGKDQKTYDVVGSVEEEEALPSVTMTYEVGTTDLGGGYYEVLGGPTAYNHGGKLVVGTDLKLYEAGFPGTEYVGAGHEVVYEGVNREISSYRAYAVGGKTLVDITLAKKAAVAGNVGDDVIDGTVAWGPYTGEIGKNWSINFVEKSENYVEKASFYRAKKADTQLVTNAWYVKVELKDFFDSVDDDEVYYKVYVTDNNDRSETTRVYVKGTYSNENVKYVDFEWTNNANTPAVWHVKKGENGTAVFDFQDKAFFTVKMYSEEKMYLDLSTAYQKAVANEYDAEFDNFFKFQGTNANFSRTGELIIESNDPNLFVYEIDKDNNLYPVDAKYVKDYQITHTNDKINGYVFNTKTLGNYVLSVDELEVEEDTEVPEEKPSNNNNSNDKENPNTGANDFVGVAVALAVVSVAGAGALALKK